MKSVFKLAIHLSREERHGFKPLLAAIFLSTIFYSCSNFVDSSKVEKNDSKSNVVEVSGKLIYGALPEKIAQTLKTPAQTDKENFRTAFPSIPTENLDFEIKAVNADDNTEVYTGETVTDGESVKYKIGIPAADSEKKYKIEVSLAIKPFDTRYEILKGKIENVKISNLKTVINQNITLSVPQDSSEFGILDLEVDCTATEIKSARASVNYNDHESAYIPAINNSGKMRFLFGEITEDELEDGMPEGSHKVKFDFYSSTNCTGVSLYSFTECINIFSALTTDTWVQNGSEPWFVTTGTGASKTTTCRITNEMIEEHKLTEIYVDPSVTTSGSGTPWSPKKTFDEAIAMLQNTSKDYTIYINGELRGPHTIPDTIQAHTLTICGKRGLNTAGEPQDGIKGYADELVGHEYDFNQITNYDELYAEGKAGRPLAVQTPVPVTLKDIKLCNSFVKSGGGGLFVNTGCSVTMENVVISGNKATKGAGGVLVQGGTVIMNGGKITGNSAWNGINSMGSGVLVRDGGSFTMNDGEISYNRCVQWGAVYLDGAESNSFTMNGGEIINNSAEGVNSGTGVHTGDYAAVYVSGASCTFTMNGGEISGNTGNTGKDGISCAGTFNIGGNAYIPNNAAGTHTIAGNINIISSLTPPAECTDGIVATLKAGAVKGGTTVITAGTGVTLANEIPKFKMSNTTEWQLYEDGKVGQLVFYVSETGNNSLVGTDEASLATVAQAVSNIKSQYTALGRKLALTIVVKGDVESQNTIFDFDADAVESILLRGYNDSPTIVNNEGTIEGITDKMNGKSLYNVLTINTDVPVTIRNILITGAYGLEHNGIQMQKGELTLESGACLSGNTAHVGTYGHWGGGIFQTGGQVTMKSGSYITGNLADGLGGGVAVKVGTFILDGGEISYNAQELHTGGGGGVYVHHGAHFWCNSGYIKNNKLNDLTGNASGSGVLRQYDTTDCSFAGDPALFIYGNYPYEIQYDSRGE